MNALLIVVLVVLGGALAYWLLITTEGTYLGVRVVALLYDWSAKRYDEIKAVRYIDEALFIGMPLMEALTSAPRARVLDVATGTARVPLALLKHSERGAGHTDGLIVGLDRSTGMLARARAALEAEGHQVTLVLGDGAALGFDDASFDAVTCLEALEFMTSGERVVAEMVRVVKPGGVLLLSNRVGVESHLFPGRVAGRGKLEQTLQRAGLAHIRSQRWQVHYDLVWARKPEAAERLLGLQQT
ncbi:MAG: methyltransferase domain-containing protein [Anaerolineae bacterium]|nr:methyltransferase domain-containing protein [Anaerolineae bacterium]